MATIAEDKPGPLLEWRKKKVADLRGLERREFTATGLEIREKDADTWTISGWASVTERYYEVGFYEERIRLQAFKRTLGENPDVQFLVNHTDLPLARTLSGTLSLEERTVPDAEGKTGLWFEADVDKLDPDAQRVERKIRRGDINAASFAFQVTDQEWSDDYTKRDIKGLSLHRGDVSVVNQGANPHATVSVRSQDAIASLRGLGSESFLSALCEWRDYTLVPLERRAGKKLSAATMEVLTQVSTLMSTAEGALDEAAPLLDELMGVSEPETETEAGASVERSMDSEKGLHRAIRSALRTPDGDEARAEVTKRAAELGLPGLVPEHWGEDGTLAEGRALATQEQRETFNDTYTALQGALDDVLVTNGDYYYVWIQDFDEANVYYVVRGELFSAAYTLVPGGAVTIDVEAAVKVRPVTEYVERSAPEPPAPVEAARVTRNHTLRAKQELDILRLREGAR